MLSHAIDDAKLIGNIEPIKSRVWLYIYRWKDHEDP